MIIGIDTGKTGAICALKDPQNFFVMDTPKDLESLDEIETFVKHVTGYYGEVTAIYVEEQYVSRTDGGTQILAYGRIAGIVIGIFKYIFQSAKLVEVHPRTWKAFFKVSADKKESLTFIERVYKVDTKIFFGKKGGFKDGRVDAYLIAVYGYNKEGGK